MYVKVNYFNLLLNENAGQYPLEAVLFEYAALYAELKGSDGVISSHKKTLYFINWRDHTIAVVGFFRWWKNLASYSL